MPPSPQPLYSDDGRWWWDGQRWVPTSPAIAGPGAGFFIQQAGFLRRLGAFAIDWVILIIGQIVITTVLSLIGFAIDSAGSGSSGVASGIAGALAWILVLVGNWLYFSLQESSARQATPGKLALGIRVVDLEGRRLTFGRATGRFFAKLLSFLTCYVGFIMAAFTARKQGLHDLIAGTLVIRSSPDPAQRLQPSAGPGASAVIVSVVAAAAVLFLTSIVVIVILLTMGGQIKNVLSNVAVALNSP